MIREARHVLRHGYQLHVLGYSVHALLRSVLEVLTPGSLNDAIDDVIAICLDDIFGFVGDEKEVIIFFKVTAA